MKKEIFTKEDLLKRIENLEKVIYIIEIQRLYPLIKSPEFSLGIAIFIAPFLFWAAITLNIFWLIILGSVCFLNFIWQIWNAFYFLGRR